MAVTPAGNEWLKAHFKLLDYSLTHCSYIGNNESIELTNKGNVERVFGPKYAPQAENPMAHLEFALKYDDLSLDFLKAVFEKTGKDEVEAFINQAPYSKYSRKIGFLYEFLTGNKIELAKDIAIKYINLLEPEEYITGLSLKDTKWKIHNNLLGTREFCPVIRKTNVLTELLQHNIQDKIDQLKENYSPEIFTRATNYLYNKETRSSYEIEKEEPSPDRMEKFVALLVTAGSEATETMLDEKRLLQLQHAIVDPRFAAKGFRDFQNYVGASLPNYQELFHYICPPPAILASLMDGLKNTAIKSTGTYAEVRAAMIAFGFVFIHPFEDGNGRLHRFLIHEILVHDGIVPRGIIIPVSAHMLNHLKEYDDILEKYSKPLLQRIRFERNNNSEITVTNPEEVEGYFRYPDLTDHCIYLVQTIHATLQEDMPDELIFLQRYDEAKKELQRIVDMPDRDINLMILFLHQNKGVFPKRRREQFAKLTDEEIDRMQQAFRMVYELGEVK